MESLIGGLRSHIKRGRAVLGSLPSVVGMPVPSTFIISGRLFAAGAKQAEQTYEKNGAQEFGRHSRFSI